MTPSKYSSNDGHVYIRHNTTETQTEELCCKRLTNIICLRSMLNTDNRRLNTRLLILIIEENTPSLFNRSIYFPILKSELSNNKYFYIFFPALYWITIILYYSITSKQLLLPYLIFSVNGGDTIMLF